MSRFKMLFLSITLLTLAGVLWASEADELREKARAMQREAAEIAEQGHREEAENLERNVIKMLEEAERLERNRPDQRDAEIRELERHLEGLRREEREFKETGNKEGLADVRREAERAERELRELHERNRLADPHEEIAQRLEHMRAAVDHLNHAGLPDIAKHVAERAAEATEKELQKHQQHQGGEAMHEMMERT